MARPAKKPSKSRRAPARAHKPARKETKPAAKSQVKRGPAKRSPLKKAPVRKRAKPVKAAKKPAAKAKAGKPVKPVSPKAKAVARAATKPPATKASVRKLAPVAPVVPVKAVSVTPVAPKKPEKVVPEKPKKPRKPEITPREIGIIKTELERQRDEFMREATEQEAAFNISQSEMSGEVSFDEEYADAGSFTFEREKEMSIGQNVRDLLDKVNHALASIARETYGLCEVCGDPIAKARLQALPYSTMCLRCKQQEERTR